MPHWTTHDMPDQTGRVAVITGANTGIGFETALELARKGAHVVLACRNATRGRGAVERIQSEGVSGTVTFAALDLADLASVERFAAEVGKTFPRVDLLILNAGVMVPPASTTEQGFELQFGVNHLGHFALTGHLLPRLADDGRVVVVSSTAASMGRMTFDDLQFADRGYQPWPAYGQSKLANQLFARELQRRLEAAGSGIRVTAAHPGWTATDLQRTSGLASFFNPLVAMRPPQGALPTLRAAVDPEAAPGAYYGPHGWFQMRGYPVEVDMVPAAHDAGDARLLWEVSESLTQVAYLPG